MEETEQTPYTPPGYVPKSPKYVVKCPDGMELRTDRHGAWPRGYGKWLDTGERKSPHNRQERRRAVALLARKVREGAKARLKKLRQQEKANASQT